MKKTKKKMRGVIGISYEMLQSPAWGFVQDGPDGNPGGVLVPINSGDTLKVFADAAEKIVKWKGTVDLDTGIASVRVDSLDRWGLAEKGVLQCQVGFQRGMAEEWTKMFEQGLRAVLIKAPKP